MPISNATVDATATTLVEPALKMASTTPGTVVPVSSTAAVTYVTMSSAAAPIETPAAGVPSLLFPGGAVPTSLATDPVIPMITSPAGGVDLDSNVVSASRKRAIVDGAEAVMQDRYIAGSTVPIQSGGMVCVAMTRAFLELMTDLSCLQIHDCPQNIFDLGAAATRLRRARLARDLSPPTLERLEPRR